MSTTKKSTIFKDAPPTANPKNPDLEGIKADSLHVTHKKIRWTWPGQKKAGFLDMSYILNNFRGQKVFNVRKGVLAFICDGVMYITKATEEKVRILKENGFKSAFFHIPTASGDGPVTI